MDNTLEQLKQIEDRLVEHIAEQQINLESVRRTISMLSPNGNKPDRAAAARTALAAMQAEASDDEPVASWKKGEMMSKFQVLAAAKQLPMKHFRTGDIAKRLGIDKKKIPALGQHLYALVKSGDLVRVITGVYAVK